MTDAERERAAWKPGDRAYCIRGSLLTKPTLEVGKVYTVKEVISVPPHASDGLILWDVEVPVGMNGIWSSRFERMPDRAHLKDPHP